MEDLGNNEVPEAAEDGAEEVEQIETEGNVLYRVFVSRMENLLRSYSHASEMYNRRNSFSGRPMPRRWREEDKKIYSKQKREAVKEMQTLITDTLPFIDEETRMEFEAFLKKHKFAIGVNYFDDLLQESNLE